jgi:hypothetical protein
MKTNKAKTIKTTKTTKTTTNSNSIEYNKLMSELKIDETYTKPFRHKINYDRVKDVIPPLEDYNFQADLLMLPTTNKGFKYLLTVVDLWSDELDAIPLKTKESSEVLQAFKKVFTRGYLSKPYATIRTDSGTEFKGEVDKYLYENSILHSVSIPGRHRQTANIENVNKLLARFLMTYINNKESQLGKTFNEWTEILDDLIKKLNKIRKRPNGNPYRPRTNTFNLKLLNEPKFKVGDIVIRKLDIPKNALNNYELTNPKFRMGDYRWDYKEPKSITKVLIYNNNFRYVLSGFPNVSYTEIELKRAPENEEARFAVKAIIDKMTQKKIIYYRVWFKKELKRNAVWIKKDDLINDGFLDEIEEFDKKKKK